MSQHKAVYSLLAAGLIAAVALTACAGAAAPQRSDNVASMLPDQAPVPVEAPSAAGGAQLASAGADAQAIASRMVVRTASLTLVVQDTVAQLDAVGKLAAELKGYIASSNSTKYDQGLQAQVTLRIPSDQFDTALQRLRALAIDVRQEQVGGQDVTAEYTDLESQLRNLEAAELQLRAIMSNTTTTEDVLSVFNQLTQVRGQIEVTKGRMQYLSQAASLATITVNLIPDKLAQPVQVAGWRLDGVAKQALEALIVAVQALLTIGVWLIIVILPIGLLLASPFIIATVIFRRLRRRKQATH